VRLPCGVPLCIRCFSTGVSSCCIVLAVNVVGLRVPAGIIGCKGTLFSANSQHLHAKNAVRAIKQGKGQVVGSIYPYCKMVGDAERQRFLKNLENIAAEILKFSSKQPPGRF
jgi:hypothetical protein